MADPSTAGSNEAGSLGTTKTGVSSCAVSKASLLQLPQELFDIIMDFAYARSGQITVIWKKAWQDQEASLASQRVQPDTTPSLFPRFLGTIKLPYVVRPFPDTIVSDFLVSKKFFTGAAQAYFSECHVKAVFRLEEVRAGGSAGILGAFAKEITTDLSNDLWLPPMPNLRKLHLSVMETIFLVHYGMGRDVRVTEEQLEATPVAKMLHGVGPKVQLELSAWEPELFFKSRPTEVFKANIKTLERVMQRRIYAGQAATGATQWRDTDLYGMTPLYHGSMVRLDSSPSSTSRFTRTPAAETGQTSLSLDKTQHTRPHLVAASKLESETLAEGLDTKLGFWSLEAGPNTICAYRRTANADLNDAMMLDSTSKAEVADVERKLPMPSTTEWSNIRVKLPYSTEVTYCPKPLQVSADALSKETLDAESASSSAVRQELQSQLATETPTFSDAVSPKIEATSTASRSNSAESSPQQLCLSKIIGVDIAPSTWPASKSESYVATSVLNEASSDEARDAGDQISPLPELQTLLTAGDPVIVEWVENKRAVLKRELVEAVKPRTLSVATKVLTVGLALLLVLWLYYGGEKVLVPGESISAGKLPKAVEVARWVAVNRSRRKRF